VASESERSRKRLTAAQQQLVAADETGAVGAGERAPRGAWGGAGIGVAAEGRVDEECERAGASAEATGAQQRFPTGGRRYRRDG
jgi:hypothetical protein